MPRPWTVVATMALAALVACSDDDAAGPTSTSSSTTSSTIAVESSATSVSTTVPTFTGDPSSPLCNLIDEGEERPVLNPFEADIDAEEVELRLRNLRNRFEEFAEVAPPELQADLDALVVALADTDATLGTYGYDLESLAEAGVTVSTFDDPVFEVVGFRLGEYRSQVCDA